MNGKKWEGIEYSYENNEEFEIKSGKLSIKEFDYSGNLMFEGEYLNGQKWNGKIKKYNKYGEIIFEGEYLNGERRGKLYNMFNSLMFEGEYLNGQKWNGKGNEYYEQNFTCFKLFEGEYLNGEKNGKGKKYVKSYLTFESEYLKGKRWNGKGYNIKGKKDFEIKNGCGNVKEYHYNGSVQFEGEYLNGKRNGKEKEYYYLDFEFNHKIINNEINLKEYYYGEKKFEGEYLNGERNGIGKEYYKNGNLKFKGEFLEGKRNGKGK